MRSVVICDWLAASDWAKWTRVPMTGDASARRYERLHNSSGKTVILMDAPPDICGSQSRFVEIARHLRGLGLAAPDILAWDDVLGVMILEDLGQIDFATHLRASPHQEKHLYELAIDVLLALQSVPPPEGLTVMVPDVGADMVDLAFQWAATDKSQNLQGEIKAHLRDLLTRVDSNPSVLSLRDFHAENLIWRPTNDGLSQVGLLDFQDAFVTHSTYDLASLLRDARRDVDPDLLLPLLNRMAGADTDIPPLKDAFHVMAVQRNLRILGIFRRLASEGKTGYLSLLPRVQGHLRVDLDAPICARISPLVWRAFPELGPRR